jgi:hypothetical protein
VKKSNPFLNEARGAPDAVVAHLERSAVLRHTWVESRIGRVEGYGSEIEAGLIAWKTIAASDIEVGCLARGRRQR